MDGKGRCIDNIFVERLWRSLKYEEVYLYAYDTVQMARAGIACYFDFFNDERPHKAEMSVRFPFYQTESAITRS